MSRFVVMPASAGSEQRASLPEVEPLDGTDLFVADAPDPRAVVEQGEVAWAAPILGEGDQESYPTGDVTIRFNSPPDASALESFAQKHAVTVQRRNEFIPEQVVVTPSEPRGTWLPDLVDRLNGEQHVAKAWPNTLSAYRRV